MAKWSNGKLATAFYEGNLHGKTVHGTLRVHHFKNCSFLINSDGDGDKMIAIRFPFRYHSSGGITLWERTETGSGRHKTIGRFKYHEFEMIHDKALVRFSELQENTYEDITSSRMVAYRDQCAILHIAGNRWLLYSLPTPADGFKNIGQFELDICTGNWTTMSLLDNGTDDIDDAIKEIIPKSAKIFYDNQWFEEYTGIIPNITEEEWETLQNKPDIYHYMESPETYFKEKAKGDTTQYDKDIQSWRVIDSKYKESYLKDPWTTKHLTDVTTPIQTPQFRK